MVKTFLVGVSILSLVCASVLVVLWWVVTVRDQVPSDGRVVVFLIGLALVQLASTFMLIRLLIRAERANHIGWLMCAALLCCGLAGSSLLNGITPALGALSGMVLLAIGSVGVLAMGRLTSH